MFVFNRPESTRRVFDVVSKTRPTRLLLVADGPRGNKKGEDEVCRQVREVIADISWPCEVSTNFAEKNLGCRNRMISGLDWVFSLVEEAIILEDDCLPDLSFFPFCQELLARYRHDSRIAYISGCNLVEQHTTIKDSYYFSRIGGIWGWASWKSEWQRYDRSLSDWPENKKRNMLADIFNDPRAVAFWSRTFDAMHKNEGPDTWDYQWVYTNLKNNSLSIVPRRNLITNIGFGEGATHTTFVDARFVLPTHAIGFPLRHPTSFVPIRLLDEIRVQDMLPPSGLRRLAAKLRSMTDRST